MSDKFVPNIIGFKKSRRRAPKGSAIGKSTLSVHNYGIKVKVGGRLFGYHIEMMRKTITNFFSRQSKVLIRCFPNRSYTTKPCDVRRGRGKGGVSDWYFYARPEKIIIEFISPTFNQAKKVFEIVKSKMPIKIALEYKK